LHISSDPPRGTLAEMDFSAVDAAQPPGPKR
jgi:hypothetical protein